MTMNQFKKNIPVRMCCACRKRFDKTSLIKFIIEDNNIAVDYNYKKFGRGAYLCNNVECFKKAKKIKALSRALKINAGEEEYDKLESDLF